MHAWLPAMVLLLAAPPPDSAEDVLKVKQGEGLKPLEIKGRVVDEGTHYIVFFKKGKSEKIFKENVLEFIPAKRVALKSDVKDDTKVGAGTTAPTKDDAPPPPPDGGPLVEKTNLPTPPPAGERLPPPGLIESRYLGVDPEVLKKYEFLIENWKWIIGGAILATALCVVMLAKLLPRRSGGPPPAAKPQNQK
jgi:hypothetical protein